MGRRGAKTQAVGSWPERSRRFPFPYLFQCQCQFRCQYPNQCQFWCQLHTHCSFNYIQDLILLGPPYRKR